jgi:uroporphyrinogen decarboxylase
MASKRLNQGNLFSYQEADWVDMGTSRDRVIQTLRHEPVDRAARDLWASPATELQRGDEWAEMLRRYPNDILRPEFRYPGGHRTRGSVSEVGQHTDAWGCVWQVNQRGEAPELKHSPLADSRQPASFRPPANLLDKANFASVNKACAGSSRFALAWTDVRPFDRLQWLRGPEAALSDLRSGARPIRDLLGALHEFYCREIALWVGTEVDGIVIQDDWGSDGGLLLPPQIFREVFKPLYRDYCREIHAHDKFAFFRSTGNLEAVMEDLIDIGFDAVHAHLFSMNVESLAERFRHRIVFWGGSDASKLLVQGTVDEVKAAVRRVRAAFDFGRVGIIAQCLWDVRAPFHNIAAAMEQWLIPMPAHAHA